MVRVPHSDQHTISYTTTVGPIEDKLADKLRKNLEIASQEALDAAQDSSTNSSKSLADFLFQKESPLFSGLSENETPLATSLARSLEVPFGATLEHVSLRWHGYEDKFAGTDAMPEGGYETVIKALAEASVGIGARLELNAPVSSVTQISGSGNIEVKTTSGTTYKASTVICTIPLAVLQSSPSSFFSPPLPPRKASAIKRVHVGTLAKILLTYPTAWWGPAYGGIALLPTNHSPDLASNDPKSLLSSIPLNCAALGSSLLIYVSCAVAPVIEKLDKKTVGQAAHEILKEKLGQGANVPEPLHSTVTRYFYSLFR